LALREYSPLELFYQTYRRWWLIALLALLGGAVGWFFHRLQPPVYETKAYFAVNIDFAQTGPLTEFQQDHTIGMFKSVMLSPDIFQQVQAAALERQIPVEELTYGKNVFIERLQFVFQLRVRSHDPHLAAAVANLWAETGYQAVQEAHGHAVQAQALRSYLKGLETCTTAGETPDAAGLCSKASLAEIQEEVLRVAAQIEEESQLSRGLLAALSFDYTEPAPLPERPVAYGANWLILAGALLGFCLGIMLVSFLAARP
jgi:uncharacterized protein involved in exopolysaccharide biosynthesis